MNCWKCGRVIDENTVGFKGDGRVYPVTPPRYAHASCPPVDIKEPMPPVLLVARHCRTCCTVMLGRKDAAPGIGPNAHKVANTGLNCQHPDFGPEVVVATVPW